MTLGERCDEIIRLIDEAVGPRLPDATGPAEPKGTGPWPATGDPVPRSFA